MAVYYPRDWEDLKCPNIRGDLIKYLADMMVKDHFLELSKLKGDVNFLYNDHDFGSNVHGLIGVALFDRAEAAIMQNLIDALSHALGMGRGYPDVQSVDWEPVRVAAEQAYKKIIERGLPNYIA